ncbi:hypothetical protein JAAARDRAFT_55484 [Jaapia argillacea MUCL 33604]|uniref:Uncharacterized protein n=1 Tax=Jaapia argillacea MUCL 33604 TaxID=933084 RepID=A0A067Q3L5_9AGAM|nr:hypothetical protein JAAARDRAFT_55484 [Jaapia argillacea MUCL 33604]
MPAIVSPKPRYPISCLIDTPSMPFLHPSSMCWSSDSAMIPFQTATPVGGSRLMSPIHLSDSAARKSSMSKPPLPCTPTKRRRRLPIHRHRSPRRRHCPRQDCPFPSRGASAFDRLPWISRMEVSPSFSNVWDLADLSQLTADQPISSSLSGVGPIRSRKVSSRSHSLPFTRDDPTIPCDPLPSFDSAIVDLKSCPRTPSPRPLTPSQVRFQNLMPILLVELGQ